VAAYRRLALVPVLALTACGGDDGGDVPTPDAGSTEDGASQPGTPLTIDDLCGLDGAYVEFVDRAFSCTADLLAILDLELEPADLDAACDALFAPYVEDGSIELGTRDDLAACFAALDSLDCTTDDIRTIDECEAVVKGTVAGGDACEVDAQCAGDAYCDTSAGATCGLCRAREANGAACDDDDECAGRRCAGATANAAGTCRDVGLVDDSCDVDDDCAGSLRCSPSTGLCEIAPAWSVDDPCVPDTSDCGFPSSDLFCDDATDSCREFAGIGDTCAGGVAVCNFVKYEICDAGTGLCRAPQTSPEGGGCNMFTGVRCQAGLSCSQPFTGGTCVDPAVGSTCDAASPDFACGLLLECKPDNTCGYEADYTGTCP
jgi:hypothetical protein